MKISCKILNPPFFLKYMKSIASFCDEGLIQFHKGIRFVGLDASRISIMELKLSDDVVETDSDENLFAPISLWSLSKIIARFSNPETLTITYNETLNSLVIQGKIQNRKKTFRLPTIDISEELEDPMPALSKIKYNAIFKIDGKDLLDAIMDGGMNAESITLMTKGTYLHVLSGGINGDSETIIDTGIEIYDNVKSSYSIDRLKRILTPMKTSNILIMLKTDFPISIYDKLTDKSHMLYYLAPRVLGGEYKDD